MTIADLFDQPGLVGLLSETTIAASTALLLVLLLRRPLRNTFGAAVSYAAWALVPAAVIAVLLPAATVAVDRLPAAVTLSVTAIPAMTVQAVAPIDVIAWLSAMWLAGAILMAVHLALQQRAFRRGLGRLQPRVDGLHQAESVAGLPAALGLLRPTIVVPSDFDTRYSFEERELMHAHERSHIARGDLHINALVAALRTVFWFNPLLHFATRHFRHDQELACDQRVMAKHPNARRSYGEAMFKTQLAAQQPLPIGCHWGYSHPLKERIAMLKQPVPSLSRWIAGSAVVTALALSVGFAAWAAQPARPVPAARAAPGALAAPVAPGAPALPVISATPATAPVPARADISPSAPPAPVSPARTAVNRTPPPAYPAEALANRIGGKVVLVIDIDPQGKPVKVEVEQSEPAGVFDQGAIDAAMKWQFAPAIKNGKAVPARVQVPVEFEPKTMRPGTAPEANMMPSASPRSAATRPTIVGPQPEAMKQPSTPLPPTRPVAPAEPATLPAPPAVLRPAHASAREAPVNHNAAAQGVGGRVLLLVDVDANGQPTHVEVQDSQLPSSFEEAAVSVVRKWTFTPAVTNGSKVAAQMRVPFVFEAFDSMPARGAGVHCDVALSLGPSGPHYCGRGR